MTQPILVTGATGVLGRALVEALTGAGLAVRQGVRDLKRASAGAPAVRFDYTDAATVGPALAGAGGLVLMAPPLDGTAVEKLAPVIECAKTSGVGHIVVISAFGANHNEQAPLRIVERLVMASGVPYTILRPNFFMDNFTEGFLAGGIRAQNGIFLAAGDGQTSFISARDIAAVAAAAFQQGLTGQELELTGPAALDHTEAARILSEASGRTIVYHALSEEAMVAGARAAGMPEGAIGYVAALYAAVRGGLAAAVTGDVERVLGRPAERFEEFARRSAAAW